MKIEEEINIICPYCAKEAHWVENKEIYGKNYGKSYMMWLCKSCDAYVGCHNNTRQPLGTLANKELRELRKQAHAVFDPFWKEWGMKRQDAYKMLSAKFGKQMHIGESTKEECMAIIKVFQDQPNTTGE